MITKSMFNKHIDAGNERRGVAPIIATLLMVAIAVVGGILIFVFAQGFFNQTDIAPPTADALVIFGWDVKDGATVSSHTGTALTVSAGTSAEKTVLKTSDGFTLFVRNTGSTPVTITEVNALGTKYTFGATAAATAVSVTVPADGKFELSTGPATVKGDNVIAAGQEATVIVAYDGAGGDIKLGKSFKVTLTTGSGQTFSATVTSGVTQGV